MPATTSLRRRLESRRRLSAGLARCGSEIEAAQRLRFRVFAGELGANLAGAAAGRDEDAFDPWCEHLVVRDEGNGEVVGTYRILTPELARRLGAYYADTEFDLRRLAPLRPSTCEIGRACVDVRYRDGATLALLWRGIGTLMRERGYAHLIGCASVGMADGGANAIRVWQRLVDTHLAPVEYRAFPRHPLLLREAPAASVGCDKLGATVPPLLKGYLRLGAWICGEPAWDPAFNTADLLVLLPLARIEARYARHFLGAAA